MNKGNISKFIKRSCVVLLCVVLLFVSVISFSTYKVKAAVPLVAVGVAALASFLGAAGVSLTTQNMTKDSFTDSLYDIANQYSSSSGAPTLEETINTQNALNYYYNNKAGEAYVSMSDSVSQWMNGFKNWFVQNFALTDSGETVVVNDLKLTTFDGKSYPYYTSFAEFTNGKVPLSSVPVSLSPEVIQLNQNYYAVVQGFDDGFLYGYYRPGVIIQYFDSLGNYVGGGSHRYASNTQNDFSFIRVCFQYRENIGWSLNILPNDNGYYNSGGYNFNFGNLFTNNDITTSSIGLSGGLTEGYSDFEQALNDARSDAGASGQVAVGTGSVSVDKPYTQENVADGILNKFLTNTGEGVLTGGYADDKAVEDETKAEKVPTVAEIGEGIVLVDGLEDFFPFCIPFDLIAIIDKFNVAPEAPVIHWDMSFANLFSNEELVLDFSGWETAAMIFRICCLIGFCVFLILKTRDMIRG